MGNNDNERIEAYINQIKNDKELQKQIDSKKSGGLKEFLKKVFLTIAPMVVGALTDALIDYLKNKNLT